MASRSIWLLVLLPVGLLVTPQRHSAAKMLMLLLLLNVGLMVLGGCGSSVRLIPSGGDGGSGSGGGGSTGTATPTGTYTVTVIGSDAGLSRSVPLTLVVQ